MKLSASVGIIHVKHNAKWDVNWQQYVSSEHEALKHKYRMFWYELFMYEYVLPVIATRCLWICLTWPPSWFRGNGYPSWTRVSTPSCTWPNAATAPTAAAAAMTQTKQMDGWGKDEQHLQSTEGKKKASKLTSLPSPTFMSLKSF